MNLVTTKFLFERVFTINRVNTRNILKKKMEIRINRRIKRNLKKGKKDVIKKLLEVLDRARVLKEMIITRDLDNPKVLFRVD